jgi:predicted PurR-regulated permease PerM
MTWPVGVGGGVASRVTGLETVQVALPLPPESVKGWPLVGEYLHRLWSLAATNIKAALAEMAPMLKPAGGKLLEIAQGALFGLFELLVSIVIAGFLFTTGPQLVALLSAFLGRVLTNRGEELAQLSCATIRNVSRGVIGIALLQALLAGNFVGLAFCRQRPRLRGPATGHRPMVRDPAAADHIWSWTAMDTTHALPSPLLVPVSLADNVLRPFLMGRGLATPTPVIMVGVIGGTILGIVGPFFGPTVLSVAWAVMCSGYQEATPSPRKSVPSDLPWSHHRTKTPR